MNARDVIDDCLMTTLNMDPDIGDADEIVAALSAAGYVVVPTKLLAAAHACMRETGWQLAPANIARNSDGILELACAEVCEQVGELLAAAQEDKG